MSSLMFDKKTGLYAIQFRDGSKRKTLRMGLTNKKQAEWLKQRVDELLTHKILRRRSYDTELADWLRGCDEALMSKLRAVGLVDGVGMSEISLGDFLKEFNAKLTCKESTKTFYGHTKRNLEEFFTKRRSLRSIKEVDADAWRAWLVKDQELAVATVARRVVAARTFWKKAIRWHYVSENPFTGVKAGPQSNEKNQQYVPREIIEKVIASCTDLEYKVIFALTRYGGLRVGEVYELRWSDINWAKGMMNVPSPKTEHHEGKGCRPVPLFWEVLKYLEALFIEPPTDETERLNVEYVIARRRIPSRNPRTTAEKLLKKAGVEIWPRLFHNLRASAETDLLQMGYPLKSVCVWLGHSPEIAARHYITSVDFEEDCRRAAGMERALQNPVHLEAQKPMQHQTAQNNTEPSGEVNSLPDNEKSESVGIGAESCEDAENLSMGDKGLEPLTLRV